MCIVDLISLNAYACSDPNHSKMLAILTGCTHGTLVHLLHCSGADSINKLGSGIAKTGHKAKLQKNINKIILKFKNLIGNQTVLIARIGPMVCTSQPWNPVSITHSSRLKKTLGIKDLTKSGPLRVLHQRYLICKLQDNRLPSGQKFYN